MFVLLLDKTILKEQENIGLKDELCRLCEQIDKDHIFASFYALAYSGTVSKQKRPSYYKHSKGGMDRLLMFMNDMENTDNVSFETALSHL
jgi:hypothetical protein